MAIIPNSDIQIATEIGQVLNSAGGSVNTNSPLTYFTPDARIKMFSKRKPVIRKVNFCQDFDSTRPDYLFEWWKGTAGNCGLTPKNVTISDLVNVIDGDKNGWEYQLPNGTEAAPFRLGDFAGYDSEAQPPIKTFSIPSYIPKNISSGVLTASITNDQPNLDGGSTLTFADIEQTRNCYIGLYIKKKNSTEYYFGTSDTTVEQGANSVSVPITSATLGEWEAYIVLATNKYQSGSPISGQLFTIPNTIQKSFEVIEKWVKINAFAQPIGNNTYSFQMTVTDYNDTHVNDCSIQVIGLSPQTYRTIEIGTLNVTKGQPYTYRMNVTVSSNEYNNCRMQIIAEGSTYPVSIVSDSPLPTEE